MKRGRECGMRRAWAAAPPVAVVGGGRRGPKGTILIVTMWIMLALAGLVLVLARAMRVEAICSANGFSLLQADAVEQGAIQYVLSRVDSLQGEAPAEADTPCEAVRIGQGAFWIIRPDYEDDYAGAYGIVDEAAKVNLNAAPLAMLSKLPGMTDELAASIVDWRDGDGTITPGGAESEYYLLLDDPYQCKNAPLETVGELFLVKGATRDILLGEDVNRNGVLDINEDDADVSDPPDNQDSRLDRGVAAFVTVYSAEQNVASDGGNRINVNDSQTQALFELLQENTSVDRAAAILVRTRQERPFQNLLDFYARTGLTMAEFQTVADRLTTTSDKVRRGLINVNTAPPQVLACLPELDDSDVSDLLVQRAGADDLSSIAWVAEALPPAKARAIGGLITTRSYQFSADIVSVAGDGRAFKRCRIVIDAQTSPPKVVYRQDLTHLGWPLAPEILTMLRTGVSLDDIAPGATAAQEVAR